MGRAVGCYFLSEPFTIKLLVWLNNAACGIKGVMASKLDGLVSFPSSRHPARNKGVHNNLENQDP